MNFPLNNKASSQKVFSVFTVVSSLLAQVQQVNQWRWSACLFPEGSTPPGRSGGGGGSQSLLTQQQAATAKNFWVVCDVTAGTLCDAELGSSELGGSTIRGIYIKITRTSYFDILQQDVVMFAWIDI